MTLAYSGCDHCGQTDDHPKVHLYTGETWHHDCLPHAVKLDILAGAHSQHPLLTARIIQAAEDGTHGDELRELATSLAMRDFGDAQMNTTGFDTAIENAIVTALTPTAGTATVGTVTVTYPVMCRFDTTMTTTDSGASTEWATSGGYTAGGVSVGANWAAASAGSRATSAAVTVTNAPAGTWAGNELWDSSGTAQRLAYGAITGGSKTVNAGDTCTIASGALSISVTGH